MHMAALEGEEAAGGSAASSTARRGLERARAPLGELNQTPQALWMACLSYMILMGAID